MKLMLLSAFFLAPTEPVEFRGRASWYGENYRGKAMANGKPFNPDAMTCAAWDWPLGTKLEVRHEGRAVIVVVTDRGPALYKARIVDLSKAAFAALADPALGVITVTIKEAKL